MEAEEGNGVAGASAFPNGVWEREGRLYPVIAREEGMASREPLVCGRIPPMLGRDDQPAQHGVVMNIIELLVGHFLGVDLLRMDAFLPNLVLALGLVGGAVKFELVQEPIPLFHSDLGE